MGLKKSRIREICKVFFVENMDVTQREVAETYGVTEKTVSGWANADKWEDARREHHSSPYEIKKILQQEALSVAQGNTPTFKPDDMSKLMAALDRCDKKLDPTIVARLLKDLDNFISKINPAFAAECTTYHKQFLQHRISLEA